MKLVEGTKQELKEYQSRQFTEWSTETATMLRHNGIGYVLINMTLNNSVTKSMLEISSVSLLRLQTGIIDSNT